MSVIALLFTAMLVPSAANAAYATGTNIDLGLLKGTGTVNEATKVGTFRSAFTARLYGDVTDDVRISSKASGTFGTPSSEVKGKPVTWMGPSAAFTNTYTFSLERSSNLSMNLFSGEEAVRRGFLSSGYEGLLNNSLLITLTGDNGFSETRKVTAATWSSVWSDLAAGNYTLSIAGKYGYKLMPDYNGLLVQGYGGEFNISDAAPGDVPLPGALVLLGTALAGAGAYGRRAMVRRKTA
ncbi:hypothetical protein IHV25_09095 [Phaeovibrio sulfidiphilus]|uniref:PEP-CTERM protein-sorting domain-containing protein n=1 Tax=Phaeovibrio sulfidiphilus TaxID=1220600 RepID=A0A8J7CWQ7_9PROT|nr:hypothetical protein [Phaeovibrio sulfidiphilus]MBE1237801.1 hypothetical protein [Phaeovibrio sulfidiphilus]